MPESMQEVLMGCLIFYTVRLAVNRLSGMLPAPPAAHHAATAGAPGVAAAGIPTGSTAARADDSSAAAGGSERAGVASPSAAGAGVKTRSDEAESEGVKYEGYAEAIAAAQVCEGVACFRGVYGRSAKGVCCRFVKCHVRGMCPCPLHSRQL